MNTITAIVIFAAIYTLGVFVVTRLGEARCPADAPKVPNPARERFAVFVCRVGPDGDPVEMPIASPDAQKLLNVRDSSSIRRK